jgi:hypothetical protein
MDLGSAKQTTPWTAVAFQKSRRETWKSIRVWLLVLVLELIGFAIPFWINRAHIHATGTWYASRYTLSSQGETIGQFTLGLVSVVVCGAATIGIVVGVRRHWRCPKCDVIPMGTWSQLGLGSFGIRRDVDTSPSVCANCGARLR